MAQTNQQIIVNEAEVDWDSKLDDLVDDIIDGPKEPEVVEASNEDVEEEVEAAPEEDNAEEAEPEYVEIKHNGKPIKLALGCTVFEQVEQPVEADRGAPEGREIKCTSHVMSSIEQHKGGRLAHVGPCVPSPVPFGDRQQ